MSIAGADILRREGIFGHVESSQGFIPHLIDMNVLMMFMYLKWENSASYNRIVRRRIVLSNFLIFLRASVIDSCEKILLHVSHVSYFRDM